MESIKTLKLESPIEAILYESLCDFGIKPELQYSISYFRVDMAYPELKLAIECDGHRYHVGEKNWSKDKYRQRRIEELGWKFERFQGWLIKKYPIACAGKIALKYFPNKLTPENKKKAEHYLEVMYWRSKC
jgi:very-short-patch-repair endonuclease